VGLRIDKSNDSRYWNYLIDVDVALESRLINFGSCMEGERRLCVCVCVCVRLKEGDLLILERN
jgi:hypothetical protein